MKRPNEDRTHAVTAMRRPHKVLPNDMYALKGFSSGICLSVNDLAGMFQDKDRVKLFQAFGEITVTGANTLLVEVFSGKCRQHTISMWLRLVPSLIEEDRVCITNVVLYCNGSACLEGISFEDLNSLQKLINGVEVAVSKDEDAETFLVLRIRGSTGFGPQTLLVVIRHILHILGCEKTLNSTLSIARYTAIVAEAEEDE